MNARFLKALLKHPDRYPQRLDESYPRVLERIAELWGTARLDAYLNDLLYDSRGDRAGFPPDVMMELMFLAGLAVDVQQAPGADMWSGELKNETAAAHTPGNDVQSVLERAVQEGNVAIVRRLLWSGGNVHRTTSNGSTLLCQASAKGHHAVVALLIESGADVNATDHAGQVALHWAALKDYHAIVKLLLERGAKANVASNSGTTPLHQAAAGGGVHSVELLLRASAEVNAADKEGGTPLHRALSGGHTRVAKGLHAAGADWTAKHRSGTTPADLVERDERLSGLTRLFKHASA